MKKIILFLFFTASILAQTSTGKEQVFSYGIRNKLPQTVIFSNLNFLTTTGNDGTQGKIHPNDLFSYYIPSFLEFNSVEKTVWNNGRTNNPSNTMFGQYCFSSNTSATYCTGFGVEVLKNNTSGSYNTAYGCHSLYSNTNGTLNTANGFESLKSNTTGSNNTAVGNISIHSNTTGSANSAYGSGSMQLNTTGNSNSAYGHQALRLNSTGTANTGIGYISLYTNETGDYNTALGYGADVSSSSLSNTTAIGNGAIAPASNTVKIGNSSITDNYLTGNIHGDAFIKSGGTGSEFLMADGSVSTSTTPPLEVNITDKTVWNNGKGNISSNSSYGESALVSNTTGTNNTTSGYASLASNTTGNYNTASGYLALESNTTGSNNTAIGYSAGTDAGALSNTTAIGSGATATASNTVVIGNASITDNYFTGKVRGGSFVTSSSAPVNGVTSGVLGEIRAAAGYIYVCSGGTTWTRATLSSY